MQLPNHDCETVQMDISNALDEGAELPADALKHAATCPECTAFVGAWTGGLDTLLSRSMPPAGLELRSAVLNFPEKPAQSNSTRRQFRGYASAAAAAIVFGLLGYTLVDIRPGSKTVVAQDTMAQSELAALKSDFRNGIAALREPASAMQRLLR